MIKKWLIVLFSISTLWVPSQPCNLILLKEMQHKWEQSENIKEAVRQEERQEEQQEEQKRKQLEEEAAKQAMKEQKAQEIENMLQEIHFSGSALVVQNGEILLDKGYGYADMGANIPNTPDTKFLIGSITKMIIAISILQLQESGKIHVDENVNKYLPFFPAEENVQIRHLLNHTSGLPNKGAKRPVFATHQRFATWVGQQPLASVPGTTWNYSDYNYVVLAYLVEVISGEPLEQYVTDHVFRPAGLEHAGFGPNFFRSDHQSKGYKQAGTTLQEFLVRDFSSLFGCGDIYMTTHDMYELDQALMNGTLLSKKSIKQLMTPGSTSTYGFGLYISPDNTMNNHGIVAGWTAFNTFNWDKDAYVILFSNVKGVHERISKEILDVLLPPTQ